MFEYLLVNLNTGSILSIFARCRDEAIWITEAFVHIRHWVDWMLDLKPARVANLDYISEMCQRPPRPTHYTEYDDDMWYEDDDRGLKWS